MVKLYKFLRRIYTDLVCNQLWYIHVIYAFLNYSKMVFLPWWYILCAKVSDKLCVMHFGTKCTISLEIQWPMTDSAYWLVRLFTTIQWTVQVYGSCKNSCLNSTEWTDTLVTANTSKGSMVVTSYIHKTYSQTWNPSKYATICMCMVSGSLSTHAAVIKPHVVTW